MAVFQRSFGNYSWNKIKIILNYFFYESTYFIDVWARHKGTYLFDNQGFV